MKRMKSVALNEPTTAQTIALLQSSS